ncbi:hypothetical protein ACI5KX_01075 [Erythrobacter sp. GH1-10]|uniref:hypothetical protein n=1 Tax=Erythrobacter sp. GH1-10 TaxID=3349334 RepID=UPI00387832AB
MKSLSPAMQRYTRRLAAFMLAYIALILAVGTLFRASPPAGILAWGMAILPAWPIIGVFWTIFRLLIEESDEFMRMMFVRQVLFATAFCLCVMTVWEFLQNYDVMPDGTGGFGTAFFWFVGLALGAIWNALSLRREAGEE